MASDGFFCVRESFFDSHSLRRAAGKRRYSHGIGGCLGIVLQYHCLFAFLVLLQQLTQIVSTEPGAPENRCQCPDWHLVRVHCYRYERTRMVGVSQVNMRAGLTKGLPAGSAQGAE